MTDYLGKPVLMLAASGGCSGGTGCTAGSARYESFGLANRREARFGTPHAQTSTNNTIATITENLPAGFDGPVRVLFNRIKFTSGSSVHFNGVSQTALGDGAERAHVWSTWEYASGSWALVWNGNSTDYGFDMEGYEYFFKQPWVWSAWTPMRFPGQYYDPETELHENWNRFYDPSVGKYLQPEPMLQSPWFARGAAGAGLTAPAYAYALNNPVAFTDPDGLDVWIEGNSKGENVPGHQSIAVGDPNGEYSSYTYAYTGDQGAGVIGNFKALFGIGGTTGRVEADYALGGPIDPLHYLKTTPAEDKKIRAMLAGLVGDYGGYQALAGPSCRTFSQNNWEAIRAAGWGKHTAHPPLKGRR